jgi:hypothetical protein
MHRGRAVLGAVNMHAALVKLDLVPLEIARLARPQAMTIGDKHHGGVAVAVTAMLASGVHEPLDLTLGEVAASLTVANCQVYSG